MLWHITHEECAYTHHAIPKLGAYIKYMDISTKFLFLQTEEEIRITVSYYCQYLISYITSPF